MKEIAAAMLLLLLMALPARQEIPPENDARTPSTLIMIPSILFKPRAPAENEPLKSAVANEQQMKQLTELLYMFQNNHQQDYTYKIVGTTAYGECHGYQCMTLSLRRSKAVYDWLIANGTSPAIFSEVSGTGAEEQRFGSGDSAEDQAKNSQVYFDVVFRKTKP